MTSAIRHQLSWEKEVSGFRVDTVDSIQQPNRVLSWHLWHRCRFCHWQQENKQWGDGRMPAVFRLCGVCVLSHSSRTGQVLGWVIRTLHLRGYHCSEDSQVSGSYERGGGGDLWRVKGAVFCYNNGGTIFGPRTLLSENDLFTFQRIRFLVLLKPEYKIHA